MKLTDIDGNLFKAYAFYASLLILKMYTMTIITVFHRIRKKVFSNPEDALKRNVKPKFDDPDVERARRGHLNDLENIPAFLFLGLVFLFTNPQYHVALWHFRVFFLARVVHMIGYQFLHSSKVRGPGFIVGMAVTISLMVQNILYFL